MNKTQSVHSYNTNQRGGATEYMIEGATGYLLEYFPVQNNLTFQPGECRQFVGINMCLKNEGDDLLSGTIPC